MSEIYGLNFSLLSFYYIFFPSKFLTTKHSIKFYGRVCIHEENGGKNISFEYINITLVKAEVPDEIVCIKKTEK
jgi:hypothetical protein